MANYTITCGKCGYSINAHSAKDVAERAEQEGWWQDEEYGWVCPNHPEE